MSNSNFEKFSESEVDLPFFGFRSGSGPASADVSRQRSSLSVGNDDTGLVAIATIVQTNDYPYPIEQGLLVWVIDGDGDVAPPMRQRQRDDGLAISTKQQRGNGSSLQSSLRRGGKVYY